MRISSSGVLFLLLASAANGFAPLHNRKAAVAPWSLAPPKTSTVLTAAAGEEDEEKKENPYQDPNFPELEFVDYSDPDYKVDQGVADEFFDPEAVSTEEQIEAMREERRVRNDEFQFETYFKEILKEGEEYKGEWTVLHTSTFMHGEARVPGSIPSLKKVAKPLMVISKGERVEIEGEPSDNRLENERLLHHERIFTDSEEKKSPEQIQQEKISMATKFCPTEVSAFEFRGQQGIMCVGDAYTVCTAVPLNGNSNDQVIEGPFSEYRSELGIQRDLMRFRVKLDYSVLTAEQESMECPPLHLKSLTVCRETLGMWPRAENYKSAIEAVTDVALFGPPGAVGGLYDPPPIGCENQASQYMLLDLEGGATLLLPHLMDQDPTVYPDSNGWVTSLDWTPGQYRFQVDRKTKAGKGILGLRTLELSEVQGADADTYRPRDGGANMRQ